MRRLLKPPNSACRRGDTSTLEDWAVSREDIWNSLRSEIDRLVQQAAAEDPRLEMFLRRKLENWAIDRGSLRADYIKGKLKKVVYEAQSGICAECSEPLPLTHWELDRLSAEFHDDPDQGYRIENVGGVHAHCNPRAPFPAGRPQV